MDGYTTPDAQPRRRGGSSSSSSSSSGRRKVSVGSSSVKNECTQLPNVSHWSKSSETVRSQQRHTSPFDICRTPISNFVKLNKSLLETNREKRKAQSSKDAQLQPGMVILKGFICHQDQVRIVKICQELGKGDGGFYRPGYRDGAKLRLHMMCLGKNWDPEKKYDDIRQIDGAQPPKIPDEFRELVAKAVQASRSVVTKEGGVSNIEEELPEMSPDICIINFYNNDGKLGLHQDRDESAESIKKGLPVVSFSIGDSAEFLFGEGRDENTARKVLLESGDVLVFGGKSRDIFHGVPKINRDSAPKCLIADSNLKPGRLNLTFRKY